MHELLHICALGCVPVGIRGEKGLRIPDYHRAIAHKLAFAAARCRVHGLWNGEWRRKDLVRANNAERSS